MALGISSKIDAGRRQERKSMYIGIGTVVLIVIIVLVVLMLRRR
jgi:predicted nucleic acid-binding Zn ribbon protein